jgi:hypothetical protein
VELFALGEAVAFAFALADFDCELLAVGMRVFIARFANTLPIIAPFLVIQKPFERQLNSDVETGIACGHDRRDG